MTCLQIFAAVAGFYGALGCLILVLTQPLTSR